ncbi:MAG: transposase [Thermodesulfobacteriota bacterium]
MTQRAAGREPLFIENNDYLRMLGLLKELTTRASITMYAFCLMPNHVHLLFSPQKANLYDAMRDLFSGYARYFNRKYERKGHLFGGPYRQSVCLDEKYLLAASVYIHLNPVRANLVSTPIQYRWSSCRLYSEMKDLRSFVDSAFILGLLADNIQTARRTYKTMLNQGLGLEIDEVLEEEKAIRHLLDKLISALPAIWERIIPGRLKKSSGEELLDAEALNRKMEELRQKGTMDRAESLRAKKFVIEQLIARGYRRNEIADLMGLSIKTIYNFMK